MALIKSALELALEKTKDMKVDPAAIEAADLKADGKRAAGHFLDDPSSVDLQKELAKLPKDKRAHMKEGIAEVLSAQLQLPNGAGFEKKLEAIGRGYAALAADAGILGGPLGGAMAEKKIQALFQQLEAFFKQYLSDMERAEQMVKKQLEPKIRQKEKEMSERLGQDVRIDPLMDPECASLYNQSLGVLRKQYDAQLTGAKAQLAELAGMHSKTE